MIFLEYSLLLSTSARCLCTFLIVDIIFIPGFGSSMYLDMIITRHSFLCLNEVMREMAAISLLVGYPKNHDGHWICEGTWLGKGLRCFCSRSRWRSCMPNGKWQRAGNVAFVDHRSCV